MAWVLNLIIFLISCGLLYFAGELIVRGLLRLARYFGVTEFVVAFFIMALASSLPNLFVGISSALRGIPSLSFGDIMGNNMIAMTLAVSLAVLFSPKKEIPSDGRTVQTTAVFTMAAAVLPLLLVSDNILSRTDGLVLVTFFVFYIFWLFSKKERFEKVYEKHESEGLEEAAKAFSDIFRIIIGIVLLLISSQGIIHSATFMSVELNLSYVLVGTLILGLGSALPEIYFAVSSAKKGETSMILGNLMGAVIIPASLVLGIVSIIHPIVIKDLETSAISRIYLILSALFFFFSAKSHSKITITEGIFLFILYILFISTIFLFY